MPELTTFCPHCNKKVHYRTAFTLSLFPFGSKNYVMNEKHAFCFECGEEVYVPEVNDYNAEKREQTVSSNIETPILYELVTAEAERRMRRCPICNVLPEKQMVLNMVKSDKELRDGGYDIPFGRYICPKCGFAPSWGRSYSKKYGWSIKDIGVWNKAVEEYEATHEQ